MKENVKRFPPSLYAYRIVMKPHRSVLGNLSLLPGVKIYVEGITVNDGKATTLVYVSFPEDMRIQKLFMEELHKHSEVIDYRIMGKKRYSMGMTVTKEVCEFYEYTLGSGRFTLFPYVLRSGRREFYIVTPESRESVFSRLAKHGQIVHFEKVPLSEAVKAASQIGLSIAMNEVVTPSQKSVLVEAYKSGYYDWPRKTSLTELARKLGISKATLSEHLRKSESRLLSLLLEAV